MHTLATDTKIQTWLDKQEILLNLQKQELQKICANFFGYYSLLVSIDENIDLLYYCQPKNHIYITQKKPPVYPQKKPNILYANPLYMPFSDDAIDLVIIHHAIEISNNPHRLLYQAARITMPEGKLIIFGSQPLSLAGIIHHITNTKNALHWRSSMPKVSTIVDWLQILGFYDIQISWQYPIIQKFSNVFCRKSNVAYYNKAIQICTKTPLPCCGSWCINATKHKFTQYIPLQKKQHTKITTLATVTPNKG